MKLQVLMDVNKYFVAAMLDSSTAVPPKGLSQLQEAVPKVAKAAQEQVLKAQQAAAKAAYEQLNRNARTQGSTQSRLGGIAEVT